MSPRAYFDDAMAAFHRAAEAVGLVTHGCGVAGTSVRLHFAGGAMVPQLLPAFSHLVTEAPPGGPALDLHVWDSASTGVAMPPPVWPLDTYGTRGEIAMFAAGDVRAAFSIEGPVLELWNRATRQAIVWMRNAAEVPTSERGAPAHRTLSWWLAASGRQLTHAGAVGSDGGAVLLAGKGGSGKSTTAVAALAAGLDYVSDDYCALEPADPPIVHSLYATAKIRAADLGRLRCALGRAVNADRLDREKALFVIDGPRRAQVRTRLPLRALVLPRVCPGAATRLSPASSSDAARAVATSTASQLPYAGAEVLRSVAAVVRRVPSYQLDLGADALAVVPDLLRALAAGNAGDLV